MYRTVTSQSQQRGFSLIELLVAMLLLVIIGGVAISFLQSASKVSSHQVGLADRQVSQRGALEILERYVQKSGFGGLPIDTTGRTMPTGVSVEVVNNVGAGTRILVGSTTAPAVEEETDVLILRGAFDLPTYQVEPGGVTYTPLNATTGDILVTNVTPTGRTQDLAPLIAAVERAANNDSGPIPEAVFLGQAYDPEIYCLAELVPGDSDVSSSTTQIRLRVRVEGAGGYADQYATLCPGGAFPTNFLTQMNNNDGSIGSITLVQEYRFYIAEADASPANEIPELASLSVAQVLPATEDAYADDPDSLDIVIAGGVVDLQLALAADTTNGGGTWDDDQAIVETVDGQDDDWLFNSDNDNAADVIWNPVVGDGPVFHYMRASMVLMAAFDSSYAAPTWTDFLEDRRYYASDPINDFPLNKFRREIVRQTFQLQNLYRWR